MPLATYIKEWRGGGGPPTLGAPHEDSYPHREYNPPFHVGVGEEREGERGGKERGAPPSLSNSDWGEGGARLPLAAPPFLH